MFLFTRVKHIVFDLFSELMVYCHLVLKIVFPQSKVKKASETYFSPKSFFFHGSYNILFTNNQNFISRRIRSTLNMELLVKSAVTKQLANYHNAELSGRHCFIHSRSIYGSKCKTYASVSHCPQAAHVPRETDTQSCNDSAVC